MDWSEFRRVTQQIADECQGVRNNLKWNDVNSIKAAEAQLQKYETFRQNIRNDSVYNNDGDVRNWYDPSNSYDYANSNSQHNSLRDELANVKKNRPINLLNCEHVRALIAPYDERLLSDAQRGHWDLWEDQSDTQDTCTTVDGLWARNPLCDIHDSGVIAIDFGTKSTVVVYQGKIEKSLPMDIGGMQATGGARYENPTVAHFINLERFLQAYRANEGRPYTKWEDLTISYVAQQQFKDSSNEQYYQYMQQIKQWAGLRVKQYIIRDAQGKSYTLKAFDDLQEEDFNPIEVYAYYIGLYINNMRNGIFLDYYLSFPVTYDPAIRTKIMESFERGIKKSLPVKVLQDEEAMAKFSINGGISEPEAYAACALQEYGFDPDPDEAIMYGVFDFGGGTADFDFGVWRASQKSRYDYAIEHLYSNGDKFLGGENLLQLLAFEIFKENKALMLEKGFTFILPPTCTPFLDGDRLIASSQEAERNMHNLQELLRPYWEEAEDYLPDIDDDDWDDDEDVDDDADADDEDAVDEDAVDEQDEELEFDLTLFDKNGGQQTGVKLKFSQRKLYKILEDRIRQGVNQFFYSLQQCFINEGGSFALRSNKAVLKGIDKVHILLAGNSCKSVILQRIFDEEIAKREEQIRAEQKVKDTGKRFFEIYPPLGTEEAYEKMEELELDPQRDNPEKPTGKTGVAYGLIECREGGSIECIHKLNNDKPPLKFYIGWKRKRKFLPFKPLDEGKTTKYPGKPDTDVWYKFIEADVSPFELFYTSQPECVYGKMPVDGNGAIGKLRCEIDVIDPEAFVYIRATGQNTLEYAVAKSADVENSLLGSIVTKELLDEF